MSDKFQFKNDVESQVCRKLGFVVRPASAEQHTGSVRMHIKYSGANNAAYVVTTVPDTPQALEGFRYACIVQAQLNNALRDMRIKQEADDEARNAELKRVAQPTS